MSSGLMKSISGIRGIVGETMTPDLAVKVAYAFAEYTRSGRIVIGRDTRCTGEAISGIVTSTLVMCGCNVIDIDIVPTPTVQVMVEELQSDGGIIISASHNPIEWNAFKLVNKDGTFLNSVQMKRFFELCNEVPAYKKWDKFGSYQKNKKCVFGSQRESDQCRKYGSYKEKKI